MTPAELLADAHAEYDAVAADLATLEVDATAARAALDAAAADPETTQEELNTLNHALRMLNERRGDLRRHRTRQATRGHVAAARLLLTPGNGAAAWLGAPPAWGAGVSFYMEAHANGE